MFMSYDSYGSSILKFLCLSQRLPLLSTFHQILYYTRLNMDEPFVQINGVSSFCGVSSALALHKNVRDFKRENIILI